MQNSKHTTKTHPRPPLLLHPPSNMPNQILDMYQIFGQYILYNYEYGTELRIIRYKLRGWVLNLKKRKHPSFVENIKYLVNYYFNISTPMFLFTPKLDKSNFDIF